jgi:hypothetical protein
VELKAIKRVRAQRAGGPLALDVIADLPDGRAVKQSFERAGTSGVVMEDFHPAVHLGSWLRVDLHARAEPVKILHLDVYTRHGDSWGWQRIAYGDQPTWITVIAEATQK